MNLKARRDRASNTSKIDSLEVILDTDNNDMATVFHTIEVVSGVNVTHGGGAKAGQYLHYKSSETDADADGIIDYSNVIMELEQEKQGISVIRVHCEVVTMAQRIAYRDAVKAWSDTSTESGLSSNKNGEPMESTLIEPSVPTPLELITGEITLEWYEDTFV
jgi:hypothetical protein